VSRRGCRVGGFALIAGALLMAALAGCGGAAPRLSPPIPTDDPPQLGQYAALPCELLRPDRVVQRHLRVPGVIVAVPAGVACRWEAAEKGRPAMEAGAEVGQGLEGVYQHRAGFGFFEPVQITRYPGVHTTSPGQRPSGGVCTTQVGVAEDTLLMVTADYTGRQASHPSLSSDPCPDADKVAEEIINQTRAANP